MDEDRCGSSVVWNIFSDVSLVNMIISVYNWDYHYPLLLLFTFLSYRCGPFYCLRGRVIGVGV